MGQRGSFSKVIGCFLAGKIMLTAGYFLRLPPISYIPDVHVETNYIFLFNFIVGLDAAGKTTILYKLKLGEIVTTIPTIGKYMTIEINH